MPCPGDSVSPTYPTLAPFYKPREPNTPTPAFAEMVCNGGKGYFVRGKWYESPTGVVARVCNSSLREAKARGLPQA